jgi:thiol-disulfide isomerase/thioredoxin
MKLSRMSPLVAGLLPLSAFLVLAQEKPGNNRIASSPRVNSEAPKFAIKTLKGNDIKSASSYKGKILLLDFWATWCPPCRAEVPNLVAAYEKHAGSNFEILGVTLDINRHVPVQKVNNFLTQNNMKWDQIYEGAQEIQAMYNVMSIPTPFLIDGDTGKVLATGEELRGSGLSDVVGRFVEAKKKEVAAKGGSRPVETAKASTDQPKVTTVKSDGR